jgi:hypothetical protein
MPYVDGGNADVMGTGRRGPVMLESPTVVSNASPTNKGAIRTMILASERQTYLTLFRVHMMPKLSAEKVGTIKFRQGKWYVDFTGRNWNHWSDTLDGSEKRQIIGLLDKLNEVHPYYYRPDDNMLARWNELIGLAPEGSADKLEFIGRSTLDD